MTNEELHRWFVYEPDTGLLRKVLGGRKPYPWRAIGSGKRYLATTVNGQTYYLHRLVWQYHHGVVPERIDHRDGDTRNNLIGNLRLCTPAQNQYNSKRKSNNRVGRKGVVFHANCPGKPYQAKLVVGGKVQSLGYFESADAAHAAYCLALQQTAGEFCRTE